MARILADNRWAKGLLAQAMGGAPRPRTNPDGSPKLAPNGKPTYASGVVVARPEGGADRGITIAVTDPAPLPLGAVVHPDGEVWVTPYESNGRVALSIVCDRLVAPAAPKENA